MDASYIEPCPYCGDPCECDLVDVGVGVVQCGPYHCEKCGASEIGAFDKNSTTACERLFGWYGPDRPPGTSANVANGKIISHEKMKYIYRKEFKNNPLWHDKSYVADWYERIRKGDL